MIGEDRLRRRRRWLRALGLSDYAGPATKSRLAATYRAVLAPAGRRRVRKLVDQGLPKALRPAVAYLFDESVASSEDRAVASRIERMREDLADLGSSFPVVSPWGGNELVLDSRHLAGVSAVSRRWGTFLRLCASHSHARIIVELGSSTGISGCYLSSARGCERFFTIEGSPDLAAVARRHLAEVSSKAKVIVGRFDEVLEPTLIGLPDRVDLAFVDGPKTREDLRSTLEVLLPFMAPGGLVILDDVRWSRTMWRSWLAVARAPGVSYALCVGRFGVVQWRGPGEGDSRPPQDLSRYLGWFGTGW